MSRIPEPPCILGPRQETDEEVLARHQPVIDAVIKSVQESRRLPESNEMSKSRKYVKRLHYLETLQRNRWGTLRVKESEHSGETARVLTIYDQPLTGYLPVEEAKFILDAINEKIDNEIKEKNQSAISQGLARAGD